MKEPEKLEMDVSNVSLDCIPLRRSGGSVPALAVQEKSGSAAFRFNPSLDGVRGIAIIFVLLLHGSYGYFRGGIVGVDLFFVLSGYLITSLLLVEYGSNRCISFRRFYARRALRLLPALIVGIGFGNLCWEYIEPSGKYEILSSLSGLLYFTNILAPEKTGLFAHLWSLSVEEHFYLLWPLVVSAVLVSLSFRIRVSQLGLFIVSIMLFRALVFHYSTWSGTDATFVVDAYRFTFCRIDSILLGALLSILLSEQRSFLPERLPRWISVAALLIFGIVGVVADQDSPYLYYGGLVVVDLLCLLIVFSAVTNSEPLFNNAVLRWIGRRSYGIYIFHAPIFLLLELGRTEHSITNLIVVTALRFGVTFLFAEVSFRFLESPLLKLKTNFQVIQQ